MSPKVSILVSVYNASTFISKCVESLFIQNFDDIEFIFVNDATKDDSIEKIQKVLEKFPNRKKQVNIIHHSANSGTSAARNTALDASTGDYILVVDCDDYIEPDMIKRLYEKALECDADIVLSNYYIENTNNTVVVNDYISELSENQFREFIIYDRCSTVLWNKLIRRTLYQRPDCLVPKQLNFLDDKHVIARIYYFATKIAKVDKAFYHYNKTNPAAITQTRVKSHFENVLLFWKLFDSFLKEHSEFEKYKIYLDKGKIKSKLSLMIGTDSYSLRKEYASMFFSEETNCLNEFKKGEKLMLILIRHKLFLGAHLFQKSLKFKNKITKLI